MSTIAVAVSGGADSLYALVSLHEQGHTLVALHGLFLPENTSPSQGPIPLLKALCQQLHIPFHVIDLRNAFEKKVITPFIHEYAQGRTPNPCALCNASIKFGLLMDAAHNLGAQILATGHYASLNSAALTAPHISPLKKGADTNKDQSYFLSLVPRQRLMQALFPLENTQKNDNIAYLHAKGFTVPVPKESQEICFVPTDAYRPFIEYHAKAMNIPLGEHGPMLLVDDEHTHTNKNHTKLQLGTHTGLWQYTEGQRRGLGIGWKEPLYVIGKDSTHNTLLLGPKQCAKLHGCVVEHINWLIPQDLVPKNCLVRVRYRQNEVPATLSITKSNIMQIHFTCPQSLTAPGQIATIYDKDSNILAGGIIKEIF